MIKEFLDLIKENIVEHVKHRGNGFSLIFNSWLSISEQVVDVDFFVGC